MGDSKTAEETKAVLRRWYDEMWGTWLSGIGFESNWAPEVVNP